MTLPTLSEDDFNTLLTDDSGTLHPVLFFATWCAPCRAFGPLLDMIAIAEGIPIKSLDIDATPQPAANHNVHSIPTLILFKDGKEVARNAGALPENKVIDLLKKHQ